MAAGCEWMLAMIRLSSDDGSQCNLGLDDCGFFGLDAE